MNPTICRLCIIQNFLTNFHWTGRYVRRRNALAFLLLLVFVLSASVWQFEIAAAQTNVLSPWKTYRREDGLASNNVLSILPGNGEIWFGTDAGISRFNGEWTTFLPAENPFTGNVNTLVADPTTGKLWAGTAEGDIVFWDGAVWTNLLSVPGSVNALLPVGGQLWIGTDSGLYVWVIKSTAVPVDFLQDVRVQALASQGNAIWVGTAQGLWLHQRDQWIEIAAADGLPRMEVSAIWVDPSGPVWVAAEGNLAWREPSTGIWTPISTEILQLNNPTPIVALTGDASGTVWGGTHGNGPFRVIEQTTLVAFSGEGEIGLTTPFVQAVAVDNDGLIWFGTQSGLFRYDEKMWVKELADNLLNPGINRISAIESSVENHLWIGTANAGIRMKSTGGDQLTERIYTTSTSNLPSDFISGLTRDFTGSIWAGTQIGVARYNSETDGWETPVPLAALPSALVTALLAENEHLWIGTDTGLVQYNLTNGAVTPIPELGRSHVKALTVDSLHRLWMGTLTDGLFVQEVNGSWVQHTSKSDGKSILAGAVVALAAAPNTSGGVWVGVDQAGINYWDGQAWHDLTDQAQLPSKLLYRFYTDPVDGSLWIGSEGGVSRYDGRTWGTLVAENVLPSAAILAIGRSGDHYWFGGRDGLTYYQPDRTKPWVRFGEVGGTLVAGHTGNIQIEAGRDIFVDYVVGDLYTSNTDISVLYRLSGPGQIGVWQSVNGDGLVLSNLNTGVVNIELQARDQAFNYSDVVGLSLDVIAASAMIQLPFLAPIRQDYFIVLMVTALIALLGLVYSRGAAIVRIRRQTLGAVNRGFNPFISGEPVRREDMFFGRYDLLQRIVDTVPNNSVMIYGERRIGKTTLLYQLAGRLREVNDTDYWFVPLFIDLEGTPEGTFFHFLMEEILNGAMTLPNAAEELHPNLTELLYYQTSDPDYTDREFSRDLRDLIEQLQEYRAARHPLKRLRVILLIDEIDFMSDYNRILQQRLRRIFMRDFAATLGIVVAGIQIRKDWDRIEAPWYNLFNEIELQPFNREHAFELLTEPIRGFYRWEPKAIEMVIGFSEGRPYRLQLYGLESVNNMLAENRRVISVDDVIASRSRIEVMGFVNPIYTAARQFLQNAGLGLVVTESAQIARCDPNPIIWPDLYNRRLYAFFFLENLLDSEAIFSVRKAVKEVDDTAADILLITNQRPTDQGWAQIGIFRMANFAIIPVEYSEIERGLTTRRESNTLRHILDSRGGVNFDPYDARDPVAGVFSFFGRVGLIEEMTTQLNEGQPIGIFGMRKIGKSSVLNYLRQQLSFPIAILNFQAVGKLNASTLFGRIVHYWSEQAFLKHQIRLNIPELNVIDEDDFVRMTASILEQIERRGNIPRLGLFLDEVELAVPRSGAMSEQMIQFIRFFRPLRGLIEENGRLSLAVASRIPSINRVSFVDGQQNPGYALFKEYYLGPLEKDDCTQMIRNLGLQVHFEFEDESVDAIFQLTGGHPFLARQFCSSLYKSRNRALGRVNISEVVAHAQNFILDNATASYLESGLWHEALDEELWGNDAAQTNKAILQMLLASEHPIPVRDLPDSNTRLPLETYLADLARFHIVNQKSSDLYEVPYALLSMWYRQRNLGIADE